MTKHLLRLDQAQITRDGTGTVTVDDPDSPVIVVVRVDRTRAPLQTPLQISELTIRARHPSARITPASLSRLPLSQIRCIAAREDGHPNDLIWRSKISPKPAGCRSWGDDHWRQVLDVYEWATATRRPGGGSQAVADMWNVARNPTAYRWLATARGLRG
jgi:hypothetical protein